MGKGYEYSVRMIFESVRRAREAAGDRLNVITAVEIGLDTPRHDYLLYGVTAEFLLEDRDLFNNTLIDLYPRVHEAADMR